MLISNAEEESDLFKLEGNINQFMLDASPMPAQERENSLLCGTWYHHIASGEVCLDTPAWSYVCALGSNMGLGYAIMVTRQ